MSESTETLKFVADTFDEIATQYIEGLKRGDITWKQYFIDTLKAKGRARAGEEEESDMELVIQSLRLTGNNFFIDDEDKVELDRIADTVVTMTLATVQYVTDEDTRYQLLTEMNIDFS